MAHTVDLTVTAEGVESNSTISAKDWVAIAQGYHFAKPLSSVALEALLDGQVA
ncbi:MAG: hypothetical protein R2932_33960 [Caldilineaceae bacterium]